MKHHVTLKADLARGTLYWVCDVEAAAEEEADTAAQHMFEAQLEADQEWAFSDFDVEAG